MNTPSTTQRLTVIDALRGFAILFIMLLHNIEHFDFWYFPEYLPEWMKTTDVIIWNALFFLFVQKFYALFAFIFGLPFYITNCITIKKQKTCLFVSVLKTEE